MVFQSFALWPHMTVAENVAFGLREQRLPKGEVTARVEAALESTEMRAAGPRRVDELSGGEQQRVALARALVVRPRCLLLDEPLASLDARLRRSMREQIRRICKSFGMTTIYVTHDQKEALAVADRVAVMQKGRILQVGSPREVYRRPSSRAVARFVGETNLIEGRVTSADGSGIALESPIGALVATPEQGVAARPGDRVWISIRPESLRLTDGAAAPAGRNHLRARRGETVYLGELAEHRLHVAGHTLTTFELNPSFAPPVAGGELAVHVDAADVVILPFDDADGAAPEMG